MNKPDKDIICPIKFNENLKEKTAFLTIECEPLGKARPRVTAHGPFAHAYTPKKTKDYELKIKNEYLQKYGYKNILEGPIEANIKAYFSTPKSVSKRIKNEMLNNFIGHTTKPDTDNVCKAILDALNGVAYKDDSQIIRMKSEKLYSEIPRIEIELKELKYLSIEK